MNRARARTRQHGELQHHVLQTARHEVGFALCYVRQLASHLVTFATGDAGEVLRLIDETRDALNQIENALLLGGMA